MISAVSLDQARRHMYAGAHFVQACLLMRCMFVTRLGHALVLARSCLRELCVVGSCRLVGAGVGRIAFVWRSSLRVLAGKLVKSSSVARMPVPHAQRRPAHRVVAAVEAGSHPLPRRRHARGRARRKRVPSYAIRQHVRVETPPHTRPRSCCAHVWDAVGAALGRSFRGHALLPDPSGRVGGEYLPSRCRRTIGDRTSCPDPRGKGRSFPRREVESVRRRLSPLR